MDKKQMMIAGIVCLVICAICIFVAIERYNANAGSVRTMNNFQRDSPLGGMGMSLEMKPATPAATKYAIFFAVLSGVEMPARKAPSFMPRIACPQRG
ncbi:MAG TPA: hypothetical protein VJJ98_02055 [Sedimentisphaerales bacterium]|nr:hypothetical protein [Sedimentisphaerales bacterium]